MNNVKIGYTWHVDETYCVRVECDDPFIYTHITLSCLNNKFALSDIHDLAYTFKRLGATVKLIGVSKLAPRARNAKTCKRAH